MDVRAGAGELFPRGDDDWSWIYTHNVEVMVRGALAQTAGAQSDERWWNRLDGMNGAEGAAFLTEVRARLLASAEHFRQLNPADGWGSFDGLIDVLTQMIQAVPQWPTRWQVTG